MNKRILFAIATIQLLINVHVNATDIEHLRASTASVTIFPTAHISSFRQINVDKMMRFPGTMIVFVDIDETLITRQYLFSYLSLDQQREILARYFLTESSSFILPAGSNEEEVKEYKDFMMRLYTFIDDQLTHHVHTEFGIPNILDSFKEKKAIVIGLTARKKCTDKRTEHTLRELGLDFGKLSNLVGINIDFDDSSALKNGIIYTGNEFYKASYCLRAAKIIADLLRLPEPVCIFHFDDNEEEIAAFTPEVICANGVYANCVVCPVNYINRRYHLDPNDPLVMILLCDEIENLCTHFRAHEAVNIYPETGDDD